jgi:hypothetical protein
VLPCRNTKLTQNRKRWGNDSDEWIFRTRRHVIRGEVGNSLVQHMLQGPLLKGGLADLLW